MAIRQKRRRTVDLRASGTMDCAGFLGHLQSVASGRRGPLAEAFEGADDRACRTRRRREVQDRSISCWCRFVSLLIAAVAALAASPADAQSVAEFYKGKTVTLIVSSAPGGGYDALSRTVAPHLSRHIPGN